MKGEIRIILKYTRKENEINKCKFQINTINKEIENNNFKLRDYKSYIEEKEKLEIEFDALSPLKTLSRGYSIITLNGKTIKEAKYLKKDDEINIKLFDGQVNAKILKKE